MNCGQNIKSARNASGMTQEELAKKCGMATITIRQYESGKREPRQEQLRLIASALGVRMSDLLDQEPCDLNGLSTGIISPADIADEMGVSVELVWRAIKEPALVPKEIRNKIASAGAMLTMELSDRESQKVKESLKEISYSLYKLNEDGRREAVERISELTEIPKYKRNPD